MSLEIPNEFFDPKPSHYSTRASAEAVLAFWNFTKVAIAVAIQLAIFQAGGACTVWTRH